jgi:hypothetical protein
MGQSVELRGQRFAPRGIMGTPWMGWALTMELIARIEARRVVVVVPNILRLELMDGINKSDERTKGMKM